jgi:ABC-type branched-subunit amino acid transport system ATPase component
MAGARDAARGARGGVTRYPVRIDLSGSRSAIMKVEGAATRGRPASPVSTNGAQEASQCCSNHISVRSRVASGEHRKMDIKVTDRELIGLGTLNVILGKNGVGKSELLRKIDASLETQRNDWFVKYISPERGGNLSFDASVEQNIRSENWMTSTRRRNRVDQFRNMSFHEFRNLEILVLRQREKDSAFPSFDQTLDQINALLDYVKLTRGAGADPELRRKKDDVLQTATTLSSGETELLSLAIEILSFCHQAGHEQNNAKSKLLLLDEPDVHLHPDLQHRLMKLIIAATKGKAITTLIATHSTAVLGALEGEDARIAFMPGGDANLTFQSVSKQLADIIPIFGAHPLSNVFNAMPILLVEGEDDVRIWQQAVRSSKGKISLWPCAAGDIQSLNKYETAASDVIGAVYDDARAYSLRDRDGSEYELSDLRSVVRMRLFCRSAENLILSNDVLDSLGLDWPVFQRRVKKWIESNSSHMQVRPLTEFAQAFDRSNADVKELRLIFMVIAGSTKPWEVAVGQAIATLSTGSPTSDGSLLNMLGPKVAQHLIPTGRV